MPAPTLQQTGKITFYYKLTDVIRKEMFGGTYVDHETLTFTRNPEGKWSTVEGTPRFQDFGPLYRLYDYELFATTNGDCGINSYDDSDMFKTPRLFTPQCQDIPSETMGSVTFGLENCDIDVLKNIICAKETLNGQLHYKLNQKMDTFTFYYTGFWSDGEYPFWINQATQTLGFPPVPEIFYNDLTAGQNYVISK